VFLERGDQDAVGHFDAIVQRDQIRVAVGGEFLWRNGAQSAIQVVDGLDEVAGEALDGEVFCGCDFALCAVLQVTEVGDGAEIFVLIRCC
jgi:hypothetical protein